MFILLSGALLPFGCVQGQLTNISGHQYRNGMVVCAYPDAAQAGLTSHDLRTTYNAIGDRAGNLHFIVP